LNAADLASQSKGLAHARANGNANTSSSDDHNDAFASVPTELAPTVKGASAPHLSTASLPVIYVKRIDSLVMK
jgi:hypothetical protein